MAWNNAYANGADGFTDTTFHKKKIALLLKAGWCRMWQKAFANLLNTIIQEAKCNKRKAVNGYGSFLEVEGNIITLLGRED